VKPRLLDLFCGAGGTAAGYQRAGFHVVGVDIAPQPRYVGDEFHQADALEFLADHGHEFDAIHASPPCQGYSVLAKRTGVGDRWPRLIEPLRDLLEASGRPWVIENVVGAPLRTPMMLCGTMFPGLRVLRHRLFESNVGLLAPGPCRKPHPLCHTVDKRKRHYGQTDEWTDFVQVNGGANCSVAAARDAMGIAWMTKSELNESIPPAYAEHVGGQLLQHLRAR